MAKHVGVDWEGHLSGLAEALDEPMETEGADWLTARPTLGQPPMFRRIRVQGYESTYSEGETMYRAFGAAALLSIAIAAPVQDAAAQDPVGGAILGGAAGAIVGGALGRRARSRSRRRRRRGHWRCHCCAGPTAAGRLPLLPAGLLSTAWGRGVGRRCTAVLRAGGCGASRGCPAATSGSGGARRTGGSNVAIA
jgi:hypothetical protein